MKKLSNEKLLVELEVPFALACQQRNY